MQGQDLEKKKLPAVGFKNLKKILKKCRRDCESLCQSEKTIHAAEAAASPGLRTCPDHCPGNQNLSFSLLCFKVLIISPWQRKILCCLPLHAWMICSSLCKWIPIFKAFLDSFNNTDDEVLNFDSVCDGTFFPSLLNEMSEIVGSFNQRAQELLELHLASGVKKYIFWFKGKLRGNHTALVQEGQDLVNYALINAIAIRKILKKYDKVCLPVLLLWINITIILISQVF